MRPWTQPQRDAPVARRSDASTSAYSAKRLALLLQGGSGEQRRGRMRETAWVLEEGPRDAYEFDLPEAETAERSEFNIVVDPTRYLTTLSLDEWRIPSETAIVRLLQVGPARSRVAGPIPAIAALLREYEPGSRPARPESTMAAPSPAGRFMALAETWRQETAMLSSTHRIVLHRAYQQIIGMGPSVLPLILRELRDRPAYWFWALAAITGEDPAAGTDRFEDARQAWLGWGKEAGLL